MAVKNACDNVSRYLLDLATGFYDLAVLYAICNAYGNINRFFHFTAPLLHSQLTSAGTLPSLLKFLSAPAG